MQCLYGEVSQSGRGMRCRGWSISDSAGRKFVFRRGKEVHYLSSPLSDLRLTLNPYIAELMRRVPQNV